MSVLRKPELIRQIHLDAKHLSHYGIDAVMVQVELCYARCRGAGAGCLVPPFLYPPLKAGGTRSDVPTTTVCEWRLLFVQLGLEV
jgi:hypothetical protein